MPPETEAGTVASATAPQHSESATSPVTAAEAAQVAPAGEDDSAKVTTERADPGTSPERAEQLRRAAFEAASRGEEFRAPSQDDPSEDEAKTEDGGPPRDANGKFLPRKVAPPGTPAPTAQPKPGQPAKPAQGLPAIIEARQRAELVQAQRTLMRDGFSAELLNGLPPAQVIALGQKRAREQAAIDTAIRRGQLTGRDVAPNGVHSPRQAVPQGTPNTGNPGDRLDQFLDELEGEGQPNTGQPQADPQSQPTAEHETPMFRELASTRAQVAINEVRADFPLLADIAVRTEVLNEMGRLDPTGSAAKESTEAVTTLMRQACYIVFGPQLAEQARTQNRARNIAAQIGQPDTASIPGEQPAKPITGEDIRAAAFKAAQTSRSPQETRQKMAQLLPGRT